MKPVFSPLGKPLVMEFIGGRRLVAVGGTFRHEPKEVRWWTYDLEGEIVILEGTSPGFVDVTVKEINRPCYLNVLPIVRDFSWKAALELGLQANEAVLLAESISDLRNAEKPF